MLMFMHVWSLQCGLKWPCPNHFAGLCHVMQLLNKYCWGKSVSAGCLAPCHARTVVSACNRACLLRSYSHAFWLEGKGLFGSQDISRKSVMPNMPWHLGTYNMASLLWCKHCSAFRIRLYNMSYAFQTISSIGLGKFGQSSSRVCWQYCSMS